MSTRLSRTPALVLLTTAAFMSLACSVDAPDPAGPTAGTSSGSGSAGMPPSASGAGGAGSSSAAGSGGTSSAGMGGGGSPSGGGGGASIGGSAGAPAGGSAGAAGMGGGGSTTAKPSAGCMKTTGRPDGGVVTVANDHYYAFPASYDGKKPMPVFMGFHGCGSGNRGTNAEDTEWMRLSKGTSFETEYVRVVPVSSSTGGCWTYGTDITRVTKMYDDLVANYCVDTGRVFATGHSSGAQFVVQILTSNHTADAKHLGFKGVAPVAASDSGAMTGPIPAMYIQGKMDKERNNGDGHETVARFRAANSCMEASMPYDSVMGCQSDGTTVVPGCVSYQGCTAPTIWCSHNDPAYSGTMHGVPCFGMKAMYDFFKSLP